MTRLQTQSVRIQELLVELGREGLLTNHAGSSLFRHLIVCWSSGSKPATNCASTPVARSLKIIGTQLAVTGKPS